VVLNAAPAQSEEPINGRACSLVLLVNPANARLFGGTSAAYPNLGLLTLGSALNVELRRRKRRDRVAYYDGALLGDRGLLDYIASNAWSIAILCLSSYTYNYSSCITLADHAKRYNRNITTIIGNDHFSALYDVIMKRRKKTFDFGFYGNDVVEGFALFCADLLEENLRSPDFYAGLVHRGGDGSIRCNAENPDEFHRLPPVDYGLQDSLCRHSDAYHAQQRRIYQLQDDVRMTVLDLARGCLKFAGPRTAMNVPRSACEFCGIIPGTKAIVALQTPSAWERVWNAVRQGYRYLFITADELPWTFWPLLREMAGQKPQWYLDLSPQERPRFMCYARADAFQDKFINRLDLIINDLGFDNFFIGLDGFTEFSLRAMNKGLSNRPQSAHELLACNISACGAIRQRNARISAGVVLTHFGMTPSILEQNFGVLRALVEQHGHLFTELDFELFCPIPGSLSFEYLINPEAAMARARELGCPVSARALERLAAKYNGEDTMDPDQLIAEFIDVFCPDLSLELAMSYAQKLQQLADGRAIYYECSSLRDSTAVIHDGGISALAQTA
jgi:hypothetical protein